MLAIREVGRQRDHADHRQHHSARRRKNQRASPRRSKEPHSDGQREKRDRFQQLRWMPDACSEAVSRLPPPIEKEGREYGTHFKVIHAPWRMPIFPTAHPRFVRGL